MRVNKRARVNNAIPYRNGEHDLHACTHTDAPGPSHGFGEIGSQFTSGLIDFGEGLMDAAVQEQLMALVGKVKIMVTWLQCIGSFSTTFTIPWPQGFLNFVDAAYGIFSIDL